VPLDGEPGVLFSRKAYVFREFQTHCGHGAGVDSEGLTTATEPLMLQLHGALLCSDGLTAHLDDSAMEKILSDFTISAQDVCNTFVTLANQAGGTDNITAVAVDTCDVIAERADA
jgi:hypothetical protein